MQTCQQHVYIVIDIDVDNLLSACFSIRICVDNRLRVLSMIKNSKISRYTFRYTRNFESKFHLIFCKRKTLESAYFTRFSRVFDNGAGDGNRTRDPHLTKVVLYR